MTIFHSSRSKPRYFFPFIVACLLTSSSDNQRKKPIRTHISDKSLLFRKDDEEDEDGSTDRFDRFGGNVVSF